MKKIILVLTGGTIGSCESDGVISTDNSRCRILELYNDIYADCQFKVYRPLDILSEDLSLSDWEKLLNFLLNIDTAGYDGMIITHGSDTLSWTAAMLGICLSRFPVPVMITAADLVPDDMRSNALANFRKCVDLIDTGDKIIRAVYRNPGNSEPTVFIPERMTEADRFTDSFGSAPENSAFKTEQPVFSRADNISFGKNVLLLHPYPSLDYENISFPENTGAVLHITCHSGSVSRRAMTILRKCREKEIPFFLCSLKEPDSSLYESADILIQNGAMPFYSMTTESAYARLLLMINGYLHI